MEAPRSLDPNQKTPESLKVLFRKYQKIRSEDILCNDEDADRLVLEETDLAESLIRQVPYRDGEGLQYYWDQFLGDDVKTAALQKSLQSSQLSSDSRMYEIKALPGLFIVPNLLPPLVQVELLNKLLHRDLSNAVHATNLDLHYYTPYRQRDCERDTTADSDPISKSLFCLSPSTKIQPKDPTVHRTITVKDALTKKLRWITLGGQYDWTEKKYPLGAPPAFPVDIGLLLNQMFPDVTPQAAIVNLYSPGDTLSVHRDVSERCGNGLISISLGCEAIFIAGNENGSKIATIRLKSGDAVYMTGPARFSWHAVPKVLAGTCPDWLRDWPAIGSLDLNYELWRGWMANKRINLNVRQMTEDDGTA